MGIASRRLAAAIVSVLMLARGTSAQPAPTESPRSFRALSNSVPQVSTNLLTELRIQWTTTPGPTAARSTANAARRHAFAVVERKSMTGRLRRERRPELSTDRLVVIVQDAAGRELDWRVIANPRVLRAEMPGPDGRLSGQVIDKDESELLITIPRMASASTVKVYQPRWAGSEYVLDVLGQTSLTPSR